MSAAEIAAHMIGDYVVQSDWAAAEKLQHHRPAVVHAVSYAACFLPLTRNPGRLALIAGTHFVIDRWRLARYVVWAKNQAAPRAWRYPLDHADASGYHQGHDRVTETMPPVGDVEGLRRWMHASSADLAELHREATGCTAPVKPPWLTTWLLIAADNGMHLVCNRLALRGRPGD